MEIGFSLAPVLVYETINARPENPDVDKNEITETVKDIETEARKGDAANEKKLSRWLTNLAGMAEDIFEVTIAALTGPQAAAAPVARKVAEKAKKAQG
ncbi:MAG: hypothetical protein HC911_01180 [Chloroflexaceae bacterium]|nr:hypothetical protein [Chloroflexaceae bacterium]